MRRTVLVVLTLCLLFSMGTPVLAEIITIIGNPLTTGGILNFTVVYVTDYQMDMTWGFGAGTDNIMIRGKYGSYPADIPNINTAPSDGYLVYYGNATSTSDTVVDMSFNQVDDISDNSNTPFTIYYKAWGRNADGTWQMMPGTGSKESRELILLTIGLITLLLTIFAWVAYMQKSMTASMMLHGVCIILWIVVAYFLYNQTYTGNTYMPTAVAFVGLAMAIVELVGVLLAAGIPEKMRKKDYDADYEADKMATKHKIYGITHKKSEEPWWK